MINYPSTQRLSIVILAGLLMSLYTNLPAQNGTTDWQLPEDYYIPAKMEMTVTHPRNDDAADWAYAKNAHPGVRWEIPIVIQGGAWPFRYEIVSDGGATGLEIGSELERSTEDGFVVHRVTEEYGVLWWDNPAEGTYDILVRVHDQDGNSIDVPVSLTVSTDGWVFVDPENGDDSNDGSIQAPLASIQEIHDRGTEFENHRIYLSGLVPMDGNRPNGNLRVAGDTPTPAVWVGMPGTEAVLEAYEGKFVLDARDFYMANLEHRHHEDFFQDDDNFIHMFTVWSDTDRLTLHDIHFSRFHGDPNNTGLGNSSIIMFTNTGNLETGRRHVAIVNNTQSGDNGIFTSAYNLRYSVIEKNRGANAHFSLQDGSVWALFYIKGSSQGGSNEYISMRANEFWEENQWNSGGNLNGALGILRTKNIELSYNTIHTTHTGRGGAIKMWTNGSLSDYTWTTDTPVWIYRNSFKQAIGYEGNQLANMPEDNVISERNVLDTGEWPTSTNGILLNIENLDNDTYFDSQMKLTGQARTDYLGRYGAEIAVQADGPVDPEPSEPVASFTFEPDEEIEPGEQVRFTDTSVDSDGTVEAWSWDFGEGTTSSEQHPVHSYSEAGDYTVSLTVTDNDGIQSEPYEQILYVREPLDAEIAECADPDEAWLFCDDFEEDRLEEYYDYFSTWGRFPLLSGYGIGDSRAMVARHGYYEADNTSPEPYGTWLKGAIGKTPDHVQYNPFGDPESAERELSWRFFLKNNTAEETIDKIGTGPLAIFYGFGPEDIPFMKAEVGIPDQTGVLEASLYTGEFDGSGEPTGLSETPVAQIVGEKPIMIPSINSPWHEIEIRVELNDPGQANGTFRLWIDGDLELNRTGIDWTGDYAEYGINVFEIYNTNNIEGVPSGVTENRSFDNMVVSPEPIGVEAEEELDPVAGIEQLQNEVDALQASGVLNRGQANALHASLRNALRQVERDHFTPAKNQLNAFINKVEGFSNGGVLTEEQAASLTVQALAVLDALEGDQEKIAGQTPGEGQTPDEVVLEQNYPNPFNPTTVISYRLPQGSPVRLDVYDMAGRRVATLVDRQMSAGQHQVQFDASNLSSGVYFYRLQAAGAVMTQKLTIIK